MVPYYLLVLISSLLFLVTAHTGSLTEARLKISLHDLINTDKQGVVICGVQFSVITHIFATPGPLH